MLLLSQARILAKRDCIELREAHVLPHETARSIHLDLPDVRVAAVLVVCENGNLDEVGAQDTLIALSAALW